MPAPDSWGGPIASEPPFVGALRSLGHEVTTAVYVYGDKDRPTPFFARVIRVLKTAFRFRRLVKKDHFDLIHLNTAFDLKTILRDSISIFIMRPKGQVVFLKLHGSEAEKFEDASFLTKRLIRFLQKNAVAFGYHTQDELNAFIRLGFDKDRFYPVKNAVTIQESLPNSFLRNQKNSDEVFEILFVSRFIPAKGLIETIEACEQLRRRGIRFRLTCVGDGPSRREADDTVGRLALGRVVTFTGHISEDEVTERFIHSDVFVFPTSHIEGFPNVLFKAVAAGLPIVTTKIRAAKDYLSEPSNCLFCSTDAENIADRLAGLIGDQSLRAAMSRNNLEFGKQLTPVTIAQEFVEIYEQVLEKSGSSRH